MALGDDKLTDLSKEQMETYPGMAHFAGTGPRGKKCSDCISLRFEREKFYCAKYEQYLAGLSAKVKKSAVAIPLSANSCNKFEEGRHSTRAPQYYNGHHRGRFDRR